MYPPSCPDHGRLVLDLALGRLDDDLAVDAEHALETCPGCRSWWHEHLEGDAAEAVDGAVATAFAGLELPARRRGSWLAAAAVIVMTVGVGALWLTPDRAAPDRVATRQAVTIQALDFETPDALDGLALVDIAIPDPDPEPVPAEPSSRLIPAAAVTAAPTRIADTAPAEVAVTESPELLFAGGFETGDLGAWVPKT